MMKKKKKKKICRIDTNAAWKKLHFILSDESNFHMINNQSIAVHAFVSHIVMPFSVDDTLDWLP